jgi:hypothetical protein
VRQELLRRLFSGSALTILLVQVLVLVPAVASDGPQLLLETDKKVYKLGENVTITLANVGDEGVDIGGYPAWIISTYPEEKTIFPPVFATLLWGLRPGENDTFVWDQKGYQFNSHISVFNCSPGAYAVSDTQGWGLHAFFTIGDFGFDVNGNGKVGLEDVVAAANAFLSYPGHPRWNPIADVNKDDQVNIVDLVLIVKNFSAR